MNIPTLYEKLLPEAKSGLEKNITEYEHSVAEVTKALKANTSCLE